jgi:hypothetical protein
MPRSLRMKTMGWLSPNMDRRYGIVDRPTLKLFGVLSGKPWQKTTAANSSRFRNKTATHLMIGAGGENRTRDLKITI